MTARPHMQFGISPTVYSYRLATAPLLHALFSGHLRKSTTALPDAASFLRNKLSAVRLPLIPHRFPETGELSPLCFKSQKHGLKTGGVG